MKTELKMKPMTTETNGATPSDAGTWGQQRIDQYNRARNELLETHHDLTTRRGILTWLASVALALTHDLEEMPRQKANTSAFVASVSLKAIQS